MSGSTDPSIAASNGPARRIQRASRACEICHSRKVRCDASTLGVPCTNCQAFGFDCKIPNAGRRKKVRTDDGGHDQCVAKEESQSPIEDRIAAASSSTYATKDGPDGLHRQHTTQSADDALHLQTQAQRTTESSTDKADKSKIYVDFIDDDISQTPIPDNGRVAYLGESSNLSFIVRRHAADNADKEIFHYPIPDVFRESTTMKLSVLDADEVEALKNRGAFLLPPRDVCDDLINTYFTKIAPQIPVVNRTNFMRQYNDISDPPPLLLLQVIFLAASRVSKNPALVDQETGSTNHASMTFWKRAKALYDADYEDDKVVVIQALLLLSWWWEGPEDVTRNVWYWIGTAIRVAQGIGMHRSVSKSKMSLMQKRTWKRVWWTCFAQDRRVAVALGRPMCINVDDSDMEMLTEDDFVEEELSPGRELRYPPNRNHVLYFIQSVKLTEIMGVVLSRQYSAASRKAQQHQSLDLTHSDMALANWLMSLPTEMQYHCSKGAREQNFWAAFLHMTYYTVLCLLHRPHLKSSLRPEAVPQAYPSRNIAFTAANMITRILEDVVHYGNLEILPSFSTYAIFSAMIFHSFEIRSPNQSVVEAAHKKLRFCQKSLAELSKVWLVATSIVTLFEAISESKTLQDRLTKSAIQGSGPAVRAQESRKRRAIDSMHESRKLSSNTRFEQKSPELSNTTSTTKLKQDAVLGGWSPSSSATSAPKPTFAPPGTQTPPDFYFSTQQQIPHTFFESYQPGFLFPQEAVGNNFTAQRPPARTQDAIFIPNNNGHVMSNLSPSGSAPQMQSPGSTWSNNQAPMDYINPLPFTSTEFDFDLMQGDLMQYPESEGSNDGRAAAPESLNVAEWYSFLGIGGNTAVT